VPKAKADQFSRRYGSDFNYSRASKTLIMSGILRQKNETWFLEVD
jgi:hypothetical protein